MRQLAVSVRVVGITAEVGLSLDAGDRWLAVARTDRDSVYPFGNPDAAHQILHKRAVRLGGVFDKSSNLTFISSVSHSSASPISLSTPTVTVSRRVRALSMLSCYSF